MGCWGITAFESDAGLDAISLIRKHLPEQGDVELRQMLAWLKADSWNAPPEVSEGVSHTSPMAVAELIVKFQEKDFSALDGIRGDKKFSSLSSFTASKESLQWVKEYLSETLFYSRKCAKEQEKSGVLWGGWFQERDWKHWQAHMEKLIGRMDELLTREGETVALWTGSICQKVEPGKMAGKKEGEERENPHRSEEESMTFFERELKKMFGTGASFSEPRFVGNCCYGRLTDQIRVKINFQTGMVADHYDRLKVTLLNRNEGTIDSMVVKFGDVWGLKKTTNPNFRDGVNPHIWSYGKEIGWYVYQPGKEDYKVLSEAVKIYLQVFQEPEEAMQMGQKIGEAGGFISANVIASVSGTVKAIEPRRMANGAMVPSIVVENDGEYKTVEGVGEDRDPSGLSKEEIRNIVKEAGIVGLGGAGFPTHVKLTPKDENAIEYILVNGAECEPYLTSDYRMMLEEPEKIVGGLKFILQLFDNAKGVIGIENNKPEAIKKLTEMVKDEPRITVCPLMTKYPQGGERSLIYAVTGRKVNSSMLPADAGCIVDNVDTVISIYMAVCKCTPLMRKIITVTGDAVADPRNFSVKLGTNYQELLDAAGGFKTEPEKVLSGGPMMGQAIFDLNIPVSKTSSALTCFTKDQVAEMEPSACIRCGKCVSVCPSHIIPVMMMQAALRDDCETFEKLNGMECMECGSCTYICPAKRPLTQAFKEMRKTVAANRRKKG